MVSDLEHQPEELATAQAARPAPSWRHTVDMLQRSSMSGSDRSFAQFRDSGSATSLLSHVARDRLSQRLLRESGALP
jgi:hypothetical protein